MTGSRVAAGFLVCLFFLSPTNAGADGASTANLVPGFLDPQTQTFTAIKKTGASAAPAAATSPAATPAPKNVKGVVTVKATVTLDAGFPANAQFQARGYLIGGSFTASLQTQVTRNGQTINSGTIQRTGLTAVATIKLPYNMLVGASETKFSINVYFSCSNVPGKMGLTLQQYIPIPANGTTTTVVNMPGAI